MYKIFLVISISTLFSGNESVKNVDIKSKNKNNIELCELNNLDYELIKLQNSMLNLKNKLMKNKNK